MILLQVTINNVGDPFRS